LVDSQKTSWWTNLWSNSNTETEDLSDTDSNDNNNNNNDFEMKNLKIPDTKTISNAWGSFWANEHTEIRKEEEEEEERQTTDVSDFN
jgi:hypothetical protein